jgi:transposase
MIFSAYFSNQIDRDTVISRLGISKRQFFRLQKRYATTKVLTHGLCGKPSNRQIDNAIKTQVLSLYKDKYRGCNYEHTSELLLEDRDIRISPDTLRIWLLEAKLTLPKRKKPKKYTRRVPKLCFNDMLQLDGTFDDFLGNGTMQCLMHLVDDATKTSLAYLYDAECTFSALDILFKWCCKYGVPKSIYSDRHSTYKVNERQHLTVEEELEGKKVRLTEFGRVCGKLLIKQIFAYSPQAKGRVEKKHQMYQDRFIKELRIKGIKTIEDANNYLICENGFVDRLNAKFTIEAKEVSSTILRPTEKELTQYFTIDTTRTVRNDYTIAYKGQILQLAKDSVVNAKSRVYVKLYLNGSIKIYAGKTEIAYSVVENYIKPVIEKKCNLATKQISIPKNTTPWRSYNPKRSSLPTCSKNNREYYNYLARTLE